MHKAANAARDQIKTFYVGNDAYYLGAVEIITGSDA